jgi:hypothetical protein
VTAKRTSNSQPVAIFDKRTVVVWACLIGSMTVASGLLLMLEPAPLAPASELALAVVDNDPAGFEGIFATDPAVDGRRWDCMIVHHTGQAMGNAQSIGQLHQTLGYGGLGYHFIIGNGTGAGDGEIQVGFRWMRQIESVYARGAISIALVGNGDQASPTTGQQAQLTSLINVLQRRLGIPAHRVFLHREVADTTSPGRLFPAARFRQSLIEQPVTASR